MIEREPTFEDDKIRTWSFAPQDREPSQFEGDPTLMQVDVEREEIYESRTYRFQPTPEVLGFLVDVISAHLPTPAPSLEQLCDFAMSLIEDTTSSCPSRSFLAIVGLRNLRCMGSALPNADVSQGFDPRVIVRVES